MFSPKSGGFPRRGNEVMAEKRIFRLEQGEACPNTMMTVEMDGETFCMTEEVHKEYQKRLKT